MVKGCVIYKLISKYMEHAQLLRKEEVRGGIPDFVVTYKTAKKDPPPTPKTPAKKLAGPKSKRGKK